MTDNKNKILIIAAGVAIIGGLVVYLGYSYLGNEKSNNENIENNDGVPSFIKQTTDVLTGNSIEMDDLKHEEGSLMKNLVKHVYNLTSSEK